MEPGVRLTFLVDSPTWGGAETYVASLLRRLPDRFACTLVATEPVPVPLAAAAEARGRLVAAGPVAGRWRRAPALHRAMAATRPDLVHVNLVDPDANRILLAVAGAGRAPAVATAHMTGPIASGPRRATLALVYRRLAAVVAVSAEIRDLLTARLELPPGLIRVVRNGVEPLAATPQRPTTGTGPLLVGGVGRLTRQKGFDLLVEATRRLVADGWPVGGAALVVPPGDVDALTEALRRLLGDPGLRADLAGRARDLAVREFDVAAMVEATMGVYDAALAGRRGRRLASGRRGAAQDARAIAHR